MHYCLGDLIIDIFQNAAESGAALVELEVRETAKGVNGAPEFRFSVKDNGKGMDGEEVKRAVNPFENDGDKHPSRKLGLGLPFLIQAADQSGGGWSISSDKGKGTTVSAWFDRANVDTPPPGEMPEVFRTVFSFPGPAEVCIRYSREEGEGDLSYEVCKSELEEILGGLEDAESQILLDQYLRSLHKLEERGNGKNDPGIFEKTQGF
ncbi:ATPase [Spirochaetia bacterium]|nr:ATPase [Spirochaetia bacterium]